MRPCELRKQLVNRTTEQGCQVQLNKKCHTTCKKNAKLAGTGWMLLFWYLQNQLHNCFQPRKSAKLALSWFKLICKSSKYGSTVMCAYQKLLMAVPICTRYIHTSMKNT